MSCWSFTVLWVTVFPFFVSTLRYDPTEVGFNLNENQTAINPADYWGEWENHTYNKSPKNWRFPFYVVTNDRFTDGDPTNNEANGTVFEHNWMTNQFRFGGDARGLMNNLDYIQGMGMKGIYLTGSPFLNMPWGGDGYGPLDFTLLDRHHGDIEDWRALITEIHRRDMYVIFDNTMATMGNLIGFDGFLNITGLTPFNFHEYDYVWKSDRKYHDFAPGDAVNASCTYPRMWGQDGLPLGHDIEVQMHGCRESEFDLYGDISGVGAYPTEINQLSKFASVQDRLREWRSDVLEKIKVMSCMQIAMFDIDGFRMDKGVQTTIDAMAEFADYQRECAKRYGKENFLMVGEIVADPRLAAVYVGRGKQPDMAFKNLTEAVVASKESTTSYIRPFGSSALDGAAFHYDIYGAMTRFLGLDGPWGKRGVDWVEQWNTILATNDMVNGITGEFDPRHMFGMTDQDVFRWPALANGTQRWLLGSFITQLGMPGIPMVLFGEEQNHYILENLADDYLFGRTPMSSSRAWQIHGCYHLGANMYTNLPFDSSGYGCYDDTVSLDHKDPSHPLRNVLKRMYELRKQYPVLNDGFDFKTLSYRIYNVYLPGSDGTPSPHGIWSVYRARTQGVQDFTGEGQGNQPVWFIYQNENRTIDYSFDCQSKNSSLALLSAFPAGTTVKNLFYPYEEFTLQSSTFKFGIEGSSEANGCVSNLTLAPYDWKAFVPVGNWVTPAPTVTRVIPPHDARLQSFVELGEQESVQIEIRFSREMDCNSVADSLDVQSTTQDGRVALLNRSSIACQSLSADSPQHVGEIPSAWSFRALLEDVSNGVHTYTIRNASAAAGNSSTGANDKFMFRIGQIDNAMVFPRSANYTAGLLQKEGDTMYIRPRAAGADKVRYSTNWGTTYSQWLDYTGANITVQEQPWSGTSEQEWTGQHVIVNYWSEKTGSSDHVQHADLDHDEIPRRWPHAFIQGPFNQYGYDGGLPNRMEQDSDGQWTFDLTAEWPTSLIVNVWGMNPDGSPDKSAAYGDVDHDGVLDWVPPDSLANNVINVTSRPSLHHLGYKIVVDDGNYNYLLVPVGSANVQIFIAILIGLVPVLSAALGVWAFVRSFYGVKFNEIGVSEKRPWYRVSIGSYLPTHRNLRKSVTNMFVSPQQGPTPPSATDVPARALDADAGAPQRRTVLIATMEYNIEDWNLGVKIGGLGVMASVMGKNLGHQDLIWVVPCVGDITYPKDTPAEPMEVVILGTNYEVEVQYHTLRNITFVLLDAPVFRRQTKGEPYPARMDDLDSAIYYSAWNQCIALAIKRFPVDMYHINDYHGTVAPLHLLPDTIPVCLSLHNAEFQGLWSLKGAEEKKEICDVYNLPVPVVEKYVQFGEVFNLLHAGASYLRIHQKGFGAVGVSKKYGKRSWARYPIFWGLTKIGGLPNPDPADTSAWNKELPNPDDIVVQQDVEGERGNLRKQAQEWAGLNVDPEAELFVFVGRWSQQKGIDLIADVFFSILEDNPRVQLICVGPVIDLFGKFAALKLEKMMEKYPGRVFSKPEFTALPPYMFSGAEFALIPSRDEPFGLVAVEFGRKGALGVGARVGGLGQMPGWWYTIESTATKHLLIQFKMAIKGALASKKEARAMMRARSALQRFPVAQWVEDLEKLQSTSLRIHHQQAAKARGLFGFPRSSAATPIGTPLGWSRAASTAPTATNTANNTAPNTAPVSRNQSRAVSPAYGHRSSERVLGTSQVGPGHSPERSRQLSRAASISSLRSSSSRSSSDSGRSPDGTPPSPQIGGRATREGRSRDTRPGLIRAQSTIVEGDENPPSDSDSDDDDVWDAALREEYFERALRDSMIVEDTAGSDLTITALPPVDIPYSSSRDSPSSVPTPFGEDDLMQDSNSRENSLPRLPRAMSLLSLDVIKGEVNGEGEKKDFNLEKVDPFFTDSGDLYYKAFEKMLRSVDAKTSENQLCIEDYLKKSEKQWFSRFHRAKLGMSSSLSTTPASSVFKLPFISQKVAASDSDDEESVRRESGREHFALNDDYVSPTGLRRLMQRKIGDWQVYSFLLALGQIIAASSYQITLLTSQVGQPANKLYAIASIYLAASIAWWVMFRIVKSVYVLSLPFLAYGLAFFLIGMGPYVNDSGGRGWLYNVATAMYSVGSASGSLFFALNFGADGGAPVQTWVFRACVIQGTQQLYIAGLWYWGSELTALSSNGSTTRTLITSTPKITAITTPIAVFLWTVGVIIFIGLPNYYRQTPGKVPSFYGALFRRKIVLWFFVMVVLQNYWLSAPYGRNWRYLWSSQHASSWAVALLMLFFFILVWGVVMLVFHRLSRQHSWILPIFSIGLGAPRWCQMLWGVSNIGAYVPWGASPAVGALLGRALWLWLGVLDAVQGVGFGMILLQTLTRFHIVFVLLAAQVIGSVATIVARATSPNKTGPGDVFPDLTLHAANALVNAWFWIALLCQLVICAGFFLFFRKEQLFKP